MMSLHLTRGKVCPSMLSNKPINEVYFDIFGKNTLDYIISQRPDIFFPDNIEQLTKSEEMTNRIDNITFDMKQFVEELVLEQDNAINELKKSVDKKTL